MVYRKRPDHLPKAHYRPLLEAMAACRHALVRSHDHVRPFGSAYNATAAVQAAIDELAVFLTGDDRFYHDGGSTSTSGWQRWQERNP